jgi:hypothetical protein
MEALLRFLLPTARRQIDEQGGFHPFGATMALDGELQLLGSTDGPEEAQLEALRTNARTLADGLVAVGICADVTIAGDGSGEAIRIELEHRDARPSTCLVPYRNNDDELTFGEPVRLEGERHIWASQPTTRTK